MDDKNSSSSDRVIKNLKEKIEEKDKKIAELAQSVAMTQPSPRRIKNTKQYTSTYTPKQIEAMKKDGRDVSNLKVEEPLVQ